MRPWERAAKRALDVTGAAVGLALSAPVIGVAALLIKQEDGGPVLFRQERVGRDGAPFEVLKLRTMVVDAESKGAGYAVDADDPRILRVGDLLRRTSIDELPQFWNVLLGQMSIVGPRPHMISHTQEYRSLIDKYMMRHAVKPGITGLAQARGFRGATPTVWHMRSRVTFDRFYVDNWSLALDIRIIIDTLRMIIRGDHNAV